MAAPPQLLRPLRVERSPTLEIDAEEEAKKSETLAYNDLVDDGGHPLYPISLIEEVSAKPQRYRDMLRPWQWYPQDDSVAWTEVFERQLERWRSFREWQKDNRGLLDDQADYLSFVDANDRHLARHYGTTGRDVWPGQPESVYQDSLRKAWKQKKVKRKTDHSRLREGHIYRRFSDYVDQAKSRLSQHGFKIPFELLEDATQQDRLTTWVEYLNYEYSWLDYYVRCVGRLQTKRDQDWRALADAGVLRSNETAESLQTTESSHQRRIELDQAEATVTSAETAAKDTLQESAKAKHGQSRFTAEERKRKLASAHVKLTAAKSAFKEARKRASLISTFIQGQRPYRETQQNVTRQTLITQWILDQMPRMTKEGETTTLTHTATKRHPRAPMASSDSDPGLLQHGNLRKRGREEDSTDDGPQQRKWKKVRNGAPSQTMVQQPRRSARIAALQCAVTGSSGVKIPLLKAVQKGATHTPMTNPSAELKRRQLRLRAKSGGSFATAECPSGVSRGKRRREDR